MTKNLLDILAARATKKPLNQKARNRAAFLANIEEIREALENGWTVKDIWEALEEEGRIPFGYQAFLGYVKRLIREQPATPGKPAEEAGQGKKVAETPTKQQKTGEIKGFEFDPIPKKEELF